MENFTPLSAFAGGLMIGAAAALLLWLNGRIAGISGIVGGLMAPDRGDIAWRLVFAAGLVAGAGLYLLAGGPMREIEITTPLPLLIVAGLLVGIGTRMGGGCTSGHGVCGIARLSARSVAATVVFILAAGMTLAVARHLLGVV